MNSVIIVHDSVRKARGSGRWSQVVSAARAEPRAGVPPYAKACNCETFRRVAGRQQRRSSRDDHPARPPLRRSAHGALPPRTPVAADAAAPTVRARAGRVSRERTGWGGGQVPFGAPSAPAGANRRVVIGSRVVEAAVDDGHKRGGDGGRRSDPRPPPLVAIIPRRPEAADGHPRGGRGGPPQKGATAAAHVVAAWVTRRRGHRGRHVSDMRPFRRAGLGGLAISRPNGNWRWPHRRAHKRKAKG